MNYFMMYPHCYYVPGSRNAAVYDILQKRTLWIDEAWKKDVLSNFRDGLSIEETAGLLNKDCAEIIKFAEWLQQMDLGYRSDKFQASVKFRPFMSSFYQEKNGLTLPLGRVMLEVSAACSLHCSFCKPERRLASMECLCGCYSKTPAIDYPIAQTIERLASVSPALLEIIGGEPLNCRQTVYEILDTAAAHNIPVLLRTNGQLADMELIQKLKCTNSELAVHLVNFVPEDSAQLEQVLRLLKLCGEAGYEKLQFDLMFDEPYFDVAQRSGEWLSKYVSIRSTVLFADRQKEQAIERLRMLTAAKEPAEYAVDFRELARLMQGHGCWQDSLCIMADGTVRRCIADENKSFGNVKSKHILDILREMRSESSASSINLRTSECQNCEFSLSCFGCEITKQKIGKHSKKQTWNCLK